MSKVMRKLKDIFTNQKELPQWVLPLVFLIWIFLEITEYGHRTFVEGFIEDFTDPVLYYIFIGIGVISFIIVYFVKRNEKNEVGEQVDKPNEEDKSKKNSNGSIILITIVVILVIILSYFNTKHSKETERRVEELLKQKKMEQIDPQTQE